MKLQLRSITTAVALLLLGVSNTSAIDIYVLSGQTPYNNTATGFGKIDSNTGLYTEINSNVGSNLAVRDLVWRDSISAFYVTKDTSNSTSLATLTTTGTISIALGSIYKNIYGMAYRATDDKMYAYDYSNDYTGTIDPSNGNFSTLNTSPGTVTAGSAVVGGRYTILNDQLYMAVDTGQGLFGTMGYTASSTFSQTANNNIYKYLALANDGTNLYGVYGDGTAGNQKLYSINPSTGGLTFMTNVTGTGLKSYFYGAAIVSVPEPSTYALGAIATGVMAAAARRRKARRIG